MSATAILREHGTFLVTTVPGVPIATSSAINHPASFFQHFKYKELQATTRLAFVIETSVTVFKGFKATNDDGSKTTAVDKAVALGSGTLWRTARALITGTALRTLEQVIIGMIGAEIFSNFFLDDPADYARDAEQLRTTSSEVVARGEASLSAFSSGVRTSVLYHVSVAVVCVGEYYLNSYRCWRQQKQQRPKETKELKWVVNKEERDAWSKFAWQSCAWSTLSTGLGCCVGTFVAPGVGSAVGKLVGMNLIYFTAEEPPLDMQ